MRTEPRVPGLDDLATLRAVWDGAADGLVLSDSEGVVLAVNATYCALYGFTPEQLVGRSFALIFPEKERAAAEQQYREVFRSGDVAAHETRVQRLDQSNLIVEARLSFIESSGQRVAMLSTIRDLTALRRAEAERDAIVASASHDLLQPLTLIKGRADLLMQQLGDDLTVDQLTHGLRAITNAIENLSQQLGSLVDEVRFGVSEPHNIDVQPVELSGWLRELVALHQDNTDQHQLFFEAPPGPLVAWIHELRIRRVVSNLLSNAMKYTPEGGEIRIRLTATSQAGGRQAVLEVEDRGVGIPSADLPHVFEPYHRATNVSGSMPGTGLGLGGARETLRQHGGSIEVESQEGRGTLFRVRVPLAANISGWPA